MSNNHEGVDDKQDSPEETALYESFKSNRNFYFISRKKPLEYHVGATVEDEHGDVKTYHFSGDSIESLTMCSTMIRGPCCDWHSNSTKLETREAEIDDPEIICLLAEAEDQLMTIHPPRDTIKVWYEGKYQTVTITEFVAQDSTGAGFIQGIRSEIQSQIQCIESKQRMNARVQARSNNNQENHSAIDMEMLDLQCMLTCLPEKELQVNPFTGESCQADVYADKAVCSASITLMIDESRQILNRDFWKTQSVQTALTTIRDLSPKEEAVWLDYTPPYPGSLQLTQINHLTDVAPILHSCKEALHSVKYNEYQSPLRFLTYLEGDRRFPSNYRQRKAINIHYDVYRDGEYQCKRACKLLFDMHEAYNAAPQTVSTTILGSRLQVEATLSLSELSKLMIRVKSDGIVVGSGTSSFQTNFAVADRKVVHVTGMGLFEGEIAFRIPSSKLKDTVPDAEGLGVSLKVSNGSFSVC